MRKLNGRELKALLVLSVVVPVSFLATLRLTGILQEPIAISEILTLDTIQWKLQRPSFGVNIWEMLSTFHVGDSVSVHFGLFIDDYHENASRYGGYDYVALVANVTASATNGHIRDMSLFFRETNENSRLNFFQELRLMRSENVTVLDYKDWAREISMNLTTKDQPKGAYFWVPVDWVLVGSKTVSHQLDAILAVTYFNGTVYKMIAQPVEIRIVPDDNNDFSTADTLVPGQEPEVFMNWLGGVDTSDFYTTYLTKGDRITVSMTPRPEQDFDLYLYNPDQVLKQSSKLRYDATDSVSYVADTSGWWFIEVRQSGGWGFYKISADVNQGSA